MWNIHSSELKIFRLKETLIQLFFVNKPENAQYARKKRKKNISQETTPTSTIKYSYVKGWECSPDGLCSMI